MYIEWLGTGSGFNTALGNTSFIVRGPERTLLVDCGFTVSPKLIELDYLKDVTDIAITHEHAHHIGGLESLAFANYFVYNRRGDDRPHLYLASQLFAHRLWHHSLKGGLEHIQTDDNKPFTATLETYFQVHVGKKIQIPGLPTARFFSTPHVKEMENYGIALDDGIWYSGDTVELPQREPLIIFQDCQFYETRSDVHISYDKLRRELPDEVRAKIHLVHLGTGWEQYNPVEDGFAGFVMPGGKFEL